MAIGVVRYGGGLFSIEFSHSESWPPPDDSLHGYFDVVAVDSGTIEHDVDAPRAHCLSLHVPLRPFQPLRPQNSASPLF